MNVNLFGNDFPVKACVHPKLGNGFEISFVQEYNIPELIIDGKYISVEEYGYFKFLTDVSNHFGTTDIDIDNWSISGCETCDWGSEYGYILQIYNATKNIPDGLI